MSNLAWLAPMRADLEQRCARWAVPLGVVVGWIDVESGGRAGESTSLREYGLFQIHPDESKDLGFDHDRIRVDATYGLDCGFRLVDHYRLVALHFLRDNVADVEAGSELHWRMAKFCHSIGAGAARACITAAGAMAGSWAVFSAYLEAHDGELLAKLHHDPEKWIGLVDRCFQIGAPYGVSSLICSPTS